MKDKRFLTWLHDRLVDEHGEDPNVDYMCKFRSIIRAIPDEQETPNMAFTLPGKEILTAGDLRTKMLADAETCRILRGEEGDDEF